MALNQNSANLLHVPNLSYNQDRKRLTKQGQVLTLEFDDKSQLSLIQEIGNSSMSRTIDNSTNLASHYKTKVSQANALSAQVDSSYDPVISEHTSRESGRGSGYIPKAEKLPPLPPTILSGTILSGLGSATIKMLSDREKFILAKNNCYVDVLLELVSSHDQVGSNSFIEGGRGGRNSQGLFNSKLNISDFDNVSQQFGGHYSKQQTNGSYLSKKMMKDSALQSSQNGFNEVKSDLRKCWMLPEELVSHSALNQLSYLILIHRKELKLSQFYNMTDQKQKRQQLVNLRHQILKHFENHQTIEKRLQKFLLMADDSGIQSCLFLLLILSDDELKCGQADSAQEFKSSMNSESSGNEKVQKQQSLLSSASKKLLRQHKGCEVTQGFFKVQCNVILKSIDNILNDQSVTQNTYRVAILLIGNLLSLNQSATKNYIKKKSTYLKLQTFFDRERENMTEREIIEMEKALKKMYSQRECFVLTKRTKQISRLKDVYIQNLQVTIDNCNQESRLIRSDSSESLIEMIQNEHSKQQENMSNGEFKLTEIGGQFNSLNKKMLVNSMDPSDLFGGNEIGITRKEMNNNLMSTELGKRKQLSTGRKNTFLNDNAQPTINLRIDTQENMALSDRSSPIGQYVKSPQPGSNYLNQSGNFFVNSQPQNSVLSNFKPLKELSPNHNDEVYSHKESKEKGGTPLDSFLEMRESYFVKDRSFFQTKDQKGEHLTSEGGNSAQNQHHVVEDKKAKKANKKQKKILYDDPMVEYHQSELKISRSNLKMTNQSTMMNTKFASRNNFQSHKSTTHDPSNGMCCFCVGSKKPPTKSMLKTQLTYPQKETIFENVGEEHESKSNTVVTMNQSEMDIYSDRGKRRSTINNSHVPEDNFDSKGIKYKDSRCPTTKMNNGMISSDIHVGSADRSTMTVAKEVKVSFGGKQVGKKSTEKSTSLMESPEKSNRKSNGCEIF